MLWYGFGLCPAIHGWGLWCVCLGLGFAFTPPIVAWVLGCVCLCARSARTPPFPAGAVCGEGLSGGRLGRGFSPPSLLLWVLVLGLPGCGGGGSVGVVLGPVLFWLCGGRCRLFRSWPPWSPLPLTPALVFFFLPPAVSASVWPAACLIPGGGVRRRVRGDFYSRTSAVVWSCWAAPSRWASPGWAGWSFGALSAGPMGVVFGVAWLGACPPPLSGSAASRLCDCPPCFPWLGLVVLVVVVVVVVAGVRVAVVVVVGLVVVVLLWVRPQDPLAFRWRVGVRHRLQPLGLHGLVDSGRG